MKAVSNDYINAFIDDHSRLVTIVYKGVVNHQTVQAATDWLTLLLERYPVTDLRGIVFDFRGVKAFDKGFVLAAKKQMARVDLSLVPIALLVHPHQDQMVALAMNVTPQEARKRTVTSEKEAFCFADEWNDLHERGFDSISRQVYEDVTIFNRYVLTDKKHLSDGGGQ